MRMPSVSRRQALAYAVVLLALLALVGRSLVGGASGSDATSATDAAAASDATPALVVDTPAADAEGTESLLVHVVGAVRHPGVYELASGARVADAVERAGGPRARAVLESINLAAELIDGQQVVVPARPRPAAAGGGTGPPGEAAPTVGASTGAPSAPAPSGPISLSSASAAQLEQLPGVGPVTAGKIIAHRDEHGPFRAVDELAAVSGIGAARIEAIRDLVRP